MKKAVLVGINEYLNPEDTLRGCVNDMNNLWMLLKNKLGFDNSDIVLLKDHKATAAAEKAAVLDMVINAEAGDSLVWSHSSHGSNVPDLSQRDGMEEVLCNTDTKENGNTGLWDLDTVTSAKWIGETIAQLHPEAHLNIILDCCNAPQGDQLKAMGRSYSRARFMPRNVVGVPVRPKTVQAVQGTIPQNVALWSACEPQQTSSDSNIDGTWQGAFTAAFLKAFKLGRSRSDIIYYARKWLKDQRYQQICHLYCWPVMAQGKFDQ